MNYFPKNAEEISLLKFIAIYQYISVNDAKYFFSTNKYYRKRITRLVESGYLKRNRLTLMLGEMGISFIKTYGYEYNPINRNTKYIPRLLCISNVGAYYNKSENVKFTPSISIKDKETITVKSRKFIGMLDINGIEYLTYYISKNRDNRYIMSVVYDIQKEQFSDNIIVLVEEGVKLNKNNFTFGKNQVLIIKDTEENRKRLQYINSIRWSDVIRNTYWTKLELAEYRFCDYTDHKHKFVSYFNWFYDTEKVSRLKQFLEVNKNRNADVICPIELKDEIKKELPKANYSIIDVDKYVDLKRNLYG